MLYLFLSRDPTRIGCRCRTIGAKTGRVMSTWMVKHCPSRSPPVMGSLYSPTMSPLQPGLSVKAIMADSSPVALIPVPHLPAVSPPSAIPLSASRPVAIPLSASRPVPTPLSANRPVAISLSDSRPVASSPVISLPTASFPVAMASPHLPTLYLPSKLIILIYWQFFLLQYFLIKI